MNENRTLGPATSAIQRDIGEARIRLTEAAKRLDDLATDRQVEDLVEAARAFRDACRRAEEKKLP